MKIIAVADFHLTLRETHGITTSDGSTRLQDKLDLISQSVKYAVDNKADLYISCGDEFDSLNPSELLRYKFIEVMAPLFEAKIPWRLIMGNHVYNAIYYNLMSEEKLLNLLGKSDFSIISTPQIEDFKGLPLVYIPWTYIKEAEEFIKNNSGIIFGHMPIIGAALNDYEVLSKEGLPEYSFKDNFAFMGHYHKHQTGNNWCYIGSIARNDFSEANQTKGFIEIRIHNKELDYGFIPLKDRNFTQFDFTEPDDPFELISKYKFDGDIVKVKLKGSNKWIYSINKLELTKKIEGNGALKVMAPDIEVVEERREKYIFSMDSNFDDNVNKYCKDKNREDCTELMQDILTEVINSQKEL